MTASGHQSLPKPSAVGYHAPEGIERRTEISQEWVARAVWPIKLDLSRLSYPALIESLAPILPGGVLVFGYLLSTNGGAASRLFATASVGYYSKLTVVAFAVYAVGFVIHLLTVSLSMISIPLLANFMQRRLFLDPSKDKQWRRLAKRFLGNDVAPQVEEPYDQEAFLRALEEARVINDPTRKWQEISRIIQLHSPLRMADYEWHGWYQILSGFFAKTDPGMGVFFEYWNTLQAMGWAGIMLLAATTSNRWSVGVVSVLAVVCGLLGVALCQIGSDPAGTKVAADLLRELKRESAGTPQL
jgi:hypothetical protein